MKRLSELQARMNETSASSSDIPSPSEEPQQPAGAGAASVALQQEVALANATVQDDAAAAVGPINKTEVGGKHKLKRKKTLYKKYNSNTSLKRKHRTNKNK